MISGVEPRSREIVDEIIASPSRVADEVDHRDKNNVVVDARINRALETDPPMSSPAPDRILNVPRALARRVSLPTIHCEIARGLVAENSLGSASFHRRDLASCIGWPIIENQPPRPLFFLVSSTDLAPLPIARSRAWNYQIESFASSTNIGCDRAKFSGKKSLRLPSS